METLEKLGKHVFQMRSSCIYFYRIIISMIDDELIYHLNNIDPDSNLLHVNQIFLCEYFMLQKYAKYCSDNFNYKLLNFNTRSFHPNINEFEAFLEVCNFNRDLLFSRKRGIKQRQRIYLLSWIQWFTCK